MGIVRLIHWNVAEAEPRVALLRAVGYDVVSTIPRGPELFQELRANPPQALVIDLSRLPSHGRDIALAVRQYKATRHVPILFIGGDPQKVERIKLMLPDAIYTNWEAIRGALRTAMARPVADPVVPRSRLEGYSGRPLAAKLGIKPNRTVGLIGAPKDFHTKIGDLPEGARVIELGRARCDLLLWFVRSRADLDRRIGSVVMRNDCRSLWIAWPKKASGVKTDLSEKSVREAGLAAGLVDYKICSIDATWSGLQFARRKQ